MNISSVSRGQGHLLSREQAAIVGNIRNSPKNLEGLTSCAVELRRGKKTSDLEWKQKHSFENRWEARSAHYCPTTRNRTRSHSLAPHYFSRTYLFHRLASLKLVASREVVSRDS